MRILYYNEGEDPAEWLPMLKAVLPEAEIRLWDGTPCPPADYALVWNPPPELFSGQTSLKAVLNLAAGVDSILALRKWIPRGVPIYRLEDAGMAIQLAEYAVHAVIRYFRHFDEYENQSANRIWEMLPPERRDEFSVGVMGTGIMGRAIIEALKPFGFPVRGWSRRKKQIPRTACYAGNELEAFLKDLRVLICALPLTSATAGILNMNTFRLMQPGSYLINLGRGAHLAEGDLLEAMRTGRIKAATLDVLQHEPPGYSHPFYRMKGITITPHIGALTFPGETAEAAARFIHAMEAGKEPGRQVDPAEGY